jgi:hypothetical protein
MLVLQLFNCLSDLLEACCCFCECVVLGVVVNGCLQRSNNIQKMYNLEMIQDLVVLEQDGLVCSSIFPSNPIDEDKK